MELGQDRSHLEAIGSLISEREDNEFISPAEFNHYLGRYELSDSKVTRIKDNLIGIVDSVFNLYLEEFK